MMVDAYRILIYTASLGEYEDCVILGNSNWAPSEPEEAESGHVKGRESIGEASSPTVSQPYKFKNQLFWSSSLEVDIDT
jgi:hypothetical protein